MKTFEELKLERLAIEERKLNDSKRKRGDNNSWNQEYTYYKQIKNSQEVIENIDEAVKMEIAANANILYNELLEMSDSATPNRAAEFYLNLKKYIIDSDTKFKDGIYFDYPNLSPLYPYDIIRVIKYFGFTQTDLYRLISEKIQIENRDDFIQFINNFYGTNIPLRTEWLELRLIPINSTKEFNHKHLLLLLRNGELMDGNYPLKYETDVLGTSYKHQEQTDPVLIKK